MNRHFAAIALFAMALAGIAGTAQAHYVYTFSGWLYHDVLCDAKLKQVPNPDSHPAQVQCVVYGTEDFPITVDVLCENPATHVVLPGRAAILGGSAYSGLTQLNESNVSKTKGRANAQVEVLADGALLQTILAAPPGTYCVNANWTPIDVLLRSFRTELRTWVCTLNDATACRAEDIGVTLDWVVETRVRATCVLDSGFTFSNPPEEGVTPFGCGDPLVQHAPFPD